MKHAAILIGLLAAWPLSASDVCTVKPASVVIQTPGAPASPYFVRASFGDQTTIVPLEVDTGSTGIVVAAEALGPNAPDAHIDRSPSITYSSSGIREEGSWKMTTVTFWDETGTKRLASTVQIPVLAVTTIVDKKKKPLAVHCTASNGSTRCPPPHMMGIGFDRSAGTPDQNPFLNLEQMLGPTPSMQRGYVLSTGFLTLGVPPDGFGFVNLQHSTAQTCNDGTFCDWATERGLISSATFQNAPAVTLVDTGIDYLIMRHNPPPPPHSAGVNVQWQLTDGTTFTFVPRSTVLLRALSVTPSGPLAGLNFVNTGRTLLSQADYLYDYTCGRVGFRPHTATK